MIPAIGDALARTLLAQLWDIERHDLGALRLRELERAGARPVFSRRGEQS